MARFGAAASKSSLAAAAQGQTLPTWETTWEFVRVLAVDQLGRDALETEKEWREHWLRAQDAPAGEPAGAAEAEPENRRRLVVPIAIALVAAVLGAAATFVFVNRTPAAVHDDSQFEGDITIPDGTVVPPNSQFTKVWRLRNSGSVVWANRFLARANEQSCQAPDLVPIPQTAPGQTVDVAVSVRTPATPGRCKIYWKMADEQGRTYFPLKRPIFLDVLVRP
ncbi:NBR1-Ig-like domain-containing protein [Actinoplanes sp. CA-054009]